MKTIRVPTREEAVEKARRAVELSYASHRGEREWLVGIAPDSYSNEEYRTEIHVLEGSPPKGFVVITGGLGSTGDVVGLDLSLVVVKRFAF